jgi:uncharacterized protein with GYD domain
MAEYILLIDWTEQGVRKIKDSPKRLDAARKLAKACGVKFGDFYMTIGKHDMLAHLTAPDDAAVAKFVLRVASAGNVRTTTLKAFTESEYRKVIGAL